MVNKNTYSVNGSLSAAISPLDRGLAYGDGVFRTLKVVDGLPVYWPQHYQKLVADCGALGIVCPSAELLMSDLQQLIVPIENAVVKIIITRGEGVRGYAPPAVTAPTRVVIKSTIPDYPKNNDVAGVHLRVCETRVASQPKLAGIKHLNRLENILARMEWNDPLIVDGVMLDTDENVIECTSANIFARFGEVLVTPSLLQSGVAGITRQLILELAHTLRLKAKIETFDLKKLYVADEVIICNSLFGAWQVACLHNHANDKVWPMQNLASDIRKALLVK